MSIIYNAYNSYQVFINTFKHNIFKIKNENEKPINDVNTQLIEHTQTAEPCRSCTDFRTFSRIRRQEFSQTQVFNYFIFLLFLYIVFMIVKKYLKCI
jgi:hypothetical protein